VWSSHGWRAHQLNPSNPYLPFINNSPLYFLSFLVLCDRKSARLTVRWQSLSPATISAERRRRSLGQTARRLRLFLRRAVGRPPIYTGSLLTTFARTAARGLSAPVCTCDIALHLSRRHIFSRHTSAAFARCTWHTRNCIALGARSSWPHLPLTRAFLRASHAHLKCGQFVRALKVLRGRRLCDDALKVMPANLLCASPAWRVFAGVRSMSSVVQWARSLG